MVDSGGQGLVQVLKGAQDAFLGKEIDYTIEGAAPSAGIVKISAQAEEEIRFGYCTEFIIVLKDPLTEEEEHEYRTFLTSMG